MFLPIKGKKKNKQLSEICFCDFGFSAVEVSRLKMMLKKPSILNNDFFPRVRNIKSILHVVKPIKSCDAWKCK